MKIDEDLQQEMWNILVLQKFPNRHKEGQGTSCLGERSHQASALLWPGLVLPLLSHGSSSMGELRHNCWKGSEKS